VYTLQNLSGKVLVIDADLIIQARQGDAGAWEAVVARHQEIAFRVAYLLLGDSADAEDVTQEAFIRAYGALDRFDTSRPLRPWLLNIVTNLARNRRRSIGRYFAALGRLARAEPERMITPPDDHGRQDQANQVWEAVRQLNADDQKIIYLRYFLDLPVAETAQTLGIAPGTVKSRLHRALGRLRDVIQEDFPGLIEENGVHDTARP
jgi:RNA polymerase sigma-70 factor (ECF subfamily)